MAMKNTRSAIEQRIVDIILNPLYGFSAILCGDIVYKGFAKGNDKGNGEGNVIGNGEGNVIGNG